jgi:signal transduction histidine kinase
LETGRLWDCDVSLSTWPGETTIPPALGVQLSFLLAESVANAVRHGRASRIGVDVQTSGDRLVLDVCDNGTGFGVGDDVIDPYCGPVSVAAGPVSIRRRVTEFGGSLDVTSSPAGAKLRIRLPMA